MTNALLFQRGDEEQQGTSRGGQIRLDQEKYVDFWKQSHRDAEHRRVVAGLEGMHI